MTASRGNWVSSALAVFTAITIANFVAFVACALYLGGDAVSGKEEGGHYYVRGVRVENGRKVFTEVTRAEFAYSKWHVYSIFLTWPITMVGLIANERLDRKRSRAGQQSTSG